MPSKTMSVVALAAIVGAAAAASKPVDPAVEVRRLTADFEYVGCFHDGNGEEIGSFAIEEYPEDETFNFLQVCAERCAGSMYFGTQYDGIDVVKCFCVSEGDLELEDHEDPSMCGISCQELYDAGLYDAGCLSAMSVYYLTNYFTGGVDPVDTPAPFAATPVEPTEEEPLA